MRSRILFPLILLSLAGLTLTVGTASPVAPSRAARSTPVPSASENIFDLTTFGAVGDGVVDDGPALQSALNAIAQAGGGTLFVPAGRYAIVTPVAKDFSNIPAARLTIQGVESSTPINVDGNGYAMASGLDLTSEFVIKTGETATALSFSGLENLLIKDLTFIGTLERLSDALVTLSLTDIADATIRHCEFYGLASFVRSGAIILANRSRLKITETPFLGCTVGSGYNGSVVQNISWKNISITYTVFADYGQRPDFYGKSTWGAVYSWIGIGNAAGVDNLSPRREAFFEHVFLDEGHIFGIASRPDLYPAPGNAPIDLIYISRLRMNVNNLASSGLYLYRVNRVFIGDSYFGWSHNASAALVISDVGEAVLDKLECVAAANTIVADAGTGKLTVINSIYEHLSSSAQTTLVINTETAAEDPAQYVAQEFRDELEREPDAAAHVYWTNNLLLCAGESQCVDQRQGELGSYLRSAPSPGFSITGRVTDAAGAGLSGVTLNLSGSHNVPAQTDAEGKFSFQGLPTSGSYLVTPVRVNYTFDSPTWATTTPSGDCVADFTAILNNHSIAGRVLDSAGQGFSGATVTLSGSQAATATTDASGNYSFTVPAEGNYTVSAAKAHYTFAPPSTSFSNLSANRTANFSGTLSKHAITGQITAVNGSALAGVTISLSGAQAAIVTTSSTGTYSFSNLAAGGNYTLRPAKQNYGFSPPSRVFSALGENQVANFTGALVNYSIAGRVFDSTGLGISGTTLTLSGSQTATTTTNTSGNYTFTATAEGSYTVSVAKVHFGFAPPSASFVNLSGNQTANFTGTLNQHIITGRITADGSDLGGVTVSLSGVQSPSAMTGPDGRFSITVPAGGTYIVQPSKTNYLFTPAGATFSNLDGNRVVDFAATVIRTVEFSTASYQIVEGETSLVVTVVRKGDTSGPASATYSTSDNSGLENCSTRQTEQASSGCDYITSIGTVRFARGETSKTLSIAIIDDGYAEGNEDFALTLSNLTGVNMGSHGSATVTIADNETTDVDNPIERAGSFVRQHYIDFFNREPDAAGLAFWTNQIASCGSDAGCVDLKRTNASAAFFLSIEFQGTAYFVYRMHKAAYGNLSGTPVPVTFSEFLPDTRQIGQGVVVGETGWEEVLATNTQAFAADFVARSQFTDAYPATLTPTQFVEVLFANAGVTPLAAERMAAINEFGVQDTSADMASRGRAVRRVADNPTLAQQEFNKAFVLVQYFGYLRRNPNDAPEGTLDFQGYNFWLGKLNQFNGNFVNAEMVKAFLVSSEYRQRFGP